ncbi:MAG: hypothetical protein LW806_10670 [Planctomycetaceae bacterium]|nr:hypothetical protein [Planctomycetaceae bacterium]
MTVRLRPWRFILLFLVAALLGHVIAVGVKLTNSEILPPGAKGTPAAASRSLEDANAWVMEEESGFPSTYLDLQGVSAAGTMLMFPSDAELSLTIAALGLMSLCLTAVPMIAVLMLMLLPWTLRRSKVRFVHLARAAAYAAVLFPVVLLMTALVLTLGGQRGANVQVLALLAIFAFTMLWIDAVCRRYLRIPHALGTAFLLSIAAMLCMFAVAAGISALV